ncbi:MAG: GTP cyclohydrolase II [Candidatus Micrarchaeota archaeon]|nr:GTP cyclohydrolase II [Candidatus Micrarchaeota archaeon]
MKSRMKKYRCGDTKKGMEIVAHARLPTQFGKFIIYAFCNNIDGEEHVAIVKGNVKGKTNVPLRMHSECLTGDALHSLRCDCHAQLVAAMKNIGKMPRGVVVYLRQEGRGIGITNKIRAYELQDKGMDTVQANLALGLPADGRDYEAAAEMIKELGIRSIALITNNPGKISDLLGHGIKVVRRIPHEFGRQKYNSEYLNVKKKKMAHLLS